MILIFNYQTRDTIKTRKILGQVETYSTSYVVCIVCAKSEEKYEIKARKNSDNKNIRC